MATISGTPANETLSGGTENDIYVFNTNSGHDSIIDAGGSDWIDFSDAITTGTGFNINLASSSANEVSFDSNNTVDWSNNVIENVIGSSGEDYIWDNTSDNILRGGQGGDFYQSASWYTGNPAVDNTDVDIIDDIGHVNGDRLNWGNASIRDTTWSAVDTDGNGNVDQLRIDWPNGKALLINNYFDNSSPDFATSNPGIGCIEGMDFVGEVNINFARVQSILSGVGQIFTAGSDYNVSFIGTSRRDTLTGAGGNDTLNGGKGADNMVSGQGNDLFVGTDEDGSDTINGGLGTDTANYDDNTVNSSLYAYINSGTILVGRGANIDTLTGVEALVGTDSQADTLDVSSIPSSVSVNLATGAVAGAGVLTSATQFEYILTGNGNDALIGNDSANWLVGGNGNDSITGGLGGDYLDGQDGNDLFNETTRNGNDTIDGGVGNDSASYDDNDAASPVYTYLLEGTAYVGRSNQMDILSSIETIVGTDSLADILDLSSDTDGVNIDLNTGSVTGMTGLNTARQFEYVLTGSGDDMLTGNDAANFLVGGSGNDNMDGGLGGDYIDGQADNDFLNGWFGDDTLVGGDGNDVLNGGGNNDTLLGGAGDDTYQYITIDGSDVISDTEGTNEVLLMGTNFEYMPINWFATDSDGDNNFDALKIAFGTGNTLTIQNYFDDTTSNLQALNQGNGYIENLNAEITGSHDFITYDFTDVKESIIQAGNRLLLQGADQGGMLLGGSGSDVLIGGKGNDSLIGGNGNDTYEFAIDFDNSEYFISYEQDVIDDLGGQDKVLLSGIGQFIPSTSMSLFKTVGGDLQIGFVGSSDNKITVHGQFTTGHEIETFYRGDGHFMTASDINQVIADMSSYAATNSISLNSLSDVENHPELLNIINGGWHT